jgi:hypothetical protein
MAALCISHCSIADVLLAKVLVLHCFRPGSLSGLLPQPATSAHLSTAAVVQVPVQLLAARVPELCQVSKFDDRQAGDAYATSHKWRGYRSATLVGARMNVPPSCTPSCGAHTLDTCGSASGLTCDHVCCNTD